jgi:dimethylargininase
MDHFGMHATRAIVRAISASFREAIVQHAAAADIDVALARVQHARYVEALRAAGLAVVELPALDAHPDACFVEDCALVAGGMALVTRSGAPSRVGEADSIAEALSRTHAVARTEAPATIDGGDCLRVGRTWFVGRSARTNAEGARRVREVFGALGFEVVEVPVRGFLHLKCVASRIDDGAVLVAEGAVDSAVFRGLEVVTIPRAEAYAANTVVVNGTALVAAGHPHTRAALERRRLRIVELGLSEIAKADGSLTCMSILLD